MKIKSRFYTLIKLLVDSFRREFYQKRVTDKTRKTSMPDRPYDPGYSELTYQDLFISEDHYQFMKELCARRKTCHPITGLWIDFGIGYKRELIGFVKNLHKKGYFKPQININNQLLQKVFINSFGVKISIDHIKHIHAEDVIINYIPEIKAESKNPNHPIYTSV